MFHRSLMGLARFGVRRGYNLTKNNVSKLCRKPGSHYYCTTSCGMKVTICGAGGNTGQPLALLLKQCPLLDEIALYDQCPTCGFGMELSHVDTKCKVSSYSGRHMLCDALKGSRVVVIVVRNSKNTFENNAPAITEIALQICNVSPSAFTIVATEPVESMVPIVAEIQRLRGVYNPRKLLGCVELNCVRANTVLADFLRAPPETVRVPVIGGATPCTMVPVLSAAVHPCIMSQEQVECVTSCIMSGNEAVCMAKGNTVENACLAGAYAVARNTVNVVKGLKGLGKIVQCAYVDSLGTCAPCCQFFASDVVLGPSGVESNLGIPELSKFENCLLCNCLPYIRNEIARAVWLVYTMCTSCCCSACCVHPGTCLTPPVVPCVPPTNWMCDLCPDSCRDEYLASICRKMTCTVGSTELCWRPREADYDAARAANLTHQMPMRSCACSKCKVPRSVRLAQEIIERNKDPCL
ncbi:malate dehydrogenase, mitochondrial-like [Choristoneura fumiferana]|uniref:malate dehydrogenase, mitochondrial-like n=1 Tax=Choristoneura fumiferana TaxID=7141 RepID=UPI003D158D04